MANNKKTEKQKNRETKKQRNKRAKKRMGGSKEQEKKAPPKGLHTYSKDMADVLKKQQESGAFMKAAISEHKEREERKEVLTKRPKQDIILMAISVILLIIGFSLVAFVIVSKKNTVDINPPSQVQSLIFADTHKEIDVSGLSKEKITKAIRDEFKNTQLEFDTVENIYLTEVISSGKVLVSTSRFLSALESNAPKSLTQSLNPQLMVGVHSYNTNQPFIIFKAVHSYNASQGILEWEEKMFDDLYLIFDIDVSGEKQSLFNKRFEDMFIKNKDARVIKGTDGEIVLMYLFIDPQTIIITRSETALEEVINRLSTQ